MSFMRMICGAALLLGVAFGATGCRTELTDEGEPCYGISEQRKRTLIATARLSLGKSNHAVTPEEFVKYIKNSEPELKIRYTSDAYGTIKVQWLLPKKRVRVVFSGDLNKDNLLTLAEVVPVFDEDDIIYAKPDAPPAGEMSFRKGVRQGGKK